MKRVLLTIFIFMCFSSSVFANQTEEKINDAIGLFKAKNYSECIKNLNTIISQDSSYPVAYYYLGLCYAKTGKKSLAIENYDKVINQSTDKSLKSMARAAKDCLGTSGFTGLDGDITINRYPTADVKIKQEIPPQKEIKNIPVNNEVAKQKNQNIIQKQDKMPTNAEIGEAIMTLKKAGLWNVPTPQQPVDNTQQKNNENQMAKLYMQQMSQQMNNPAYLMMQMNGNNNNNSNSGMNMMNMLPFMMNNQNAGSNNNAANQQLLQTMMMSQMMPNLDFTSTDKK